eukprot:1246447-Prorocentrum_lima.AAC.1
MAVVWENGTAVAGGCKTGGFSTSNRSSPSSVIARRSVGECTRREVRPCSPVCMECWNGRG